MKYYLLLFGLLLLQNANSQIKPEFFPEDILNNTQDVICYCKPGLTAQSRAKGVSISYGLVGSGNYIAEEPTTFTGVGSTLNKLSHIEFKLKIPVLLKERTKVLLSYKYFSEFYDFQQIGVDFSETFQNLNTNNLKSNQYGLILSHSVNERNYFALQYKYAANGNYTGWTDLDSRYAIHKLIGVYGFKKSEDFEWGIGLSFSKSFRRTNIIPFLLYNRNFNEKWGLEALFPANIFLRCNLDPRTIALLGIEYSSQSFRLGIEDTPSDPLDYAFNHAEILFSISLERHITSWIWWNLQAGYQQNFSSDFESKSQVSPFFQADPANGFFLRIGVFVSPDL